MRPLFLTLLLVALLFTTSPKSTTLAAGWTATEVFANLIAEANDCLRRDMTLKGPSSLLIDYWMCLGTARLTNEARTWYGDSHPFPLPRELGAAATLTHTAEELTRTMIGTDNARWRTDVLAVLDLSDAYLASFQAEGSGMQSRTSDGDVIYAATLSVASHCIDSMASHIQIYDAGPGIEWLFGNCQPQSDAVAVQFADPSLLIGLPTELRSAAEQIRSAALLTHRLFDSDGKAVAAEILRLTDQANDNIRAWEQRKCQENESRCPRYDEGGPTGPDAVAARLLDSLPVDLPDFPACLAVESEGGYDFAEVGTRFPGIPDADEQLQALGWEAGAYRQFSCDEPPNEGPRWVDLSVHEFIYHEGAADAVAFFANARTVGTRLLETTAMDIGDQRAAVAGPSEQGTEYTLYASKGDQLFRVTVIAANGDPRPDAERLMAEFAGLALPSTSQVQGIAGLLPTTQDVADAFAAQGVPHRVVVAEEGTQPTEEIAAWLGGRDAASQIRTWRWQTNGFRVYRMGDPLGSSEVTISIHEFADGPLIHRSDGAVLSGELVALDVFAERWAHLRGVTAQRAGIIGPGVSRQAGSWKIVSDHEATLFVASFNHVIRVTVVTSGGPSLDAVEQVMNAVLERVEQAR